MGSCNIRVEPIHLGSVAAAPASCGVYGSTRAELSRSGETLNPLLELRVYCCGRPERSAGAALMRLIMGLLLRACAVQGDAARAKVVPAGSCASVYQI